MRREGPHRVVADWIRGYHLQTREPETVALAALPLVLLYGLGLTIASPDARSGVDPVSAAIQAQVGESAFIWGQIGLAALVVCVCAIRLRGRIARPMALTATLIGESIVYGLFMGGGIVLLLDQVFALGPFLIPGDLLDRAVVSAGAGFFEELVFRLLLLTAIGWLFVRYLQMAPWLAVTVAVALSSLCFAAAHHLAGEPLELYPFAYRTVAGAAFAGLFLARGFAVAAWTHAVYDFYVLGISG